MRYRLLLVLCLWGFSSSGWTADTRALFAGGCFWCMEEAFQQVPGVTEVISGFSGGSKLDPSYKEVVGGTTGHYETILVHYDAKEVSYAQLLQIFWRNIDPFDDRGQFCDRGSSYRSAIFYLDEKQKQEAVRSKQDLGQKQSSPIVTPILAAGTFYAADEEHQDFFERNPLHYKYYKFACGRAKRLERIWGSGGD